MVEPQAESRIPDTVHEMFGSSRRKVQVALTIGKDILTDNVDGVDEIKPDLETGALTLLTAGAVIAVYHPDRWVLARIVSE